MIPKIAWCYWEGPTYPYIRYCLETIKKRAGVQVNLITPENVGEYITNGVDINARWKEITWIAQKIDCLRIALLHKYGGCWIDADTVLIRDLNALFDENEAKDMVGMRWKRTGRILNGYFMAAKGSRFMSYCLEWINNKLSREFKQNYHEHGGVLFGECLFGEINSVNDGLMEFMDLETFLPIEFPFSQDIWWTRKKVDPFITGKTVAIGLNHSQYKDGTRAKEVDDHIREEILFGDIFRYSKEIGDV